MPNLNYLFRTFDFGFKHSSLIPLTGASCHFQLTNQQLNFFPIIHFILFLLICWPDIK